MKILERSKMRGGGRRVVLENEGGEVITLCSQAASNYEELIDEYLQSRKKAKEGTDDRPFPASNQNNLTLEEGDSNGSEGKSAADL